MSAPRFDPSEARRIADEADRWLLDDTDSDGHRHWSAIIRDLKDNLESAISAIEGPEDGAGEILDVETGALLKAGLNGFAVELLTESIRSFKDFETCGVFSFRYRGVKYALSFDADSDMHHSDRREAAGVLRADYHWAEKERKGSILATRAPSESAVTDEMAWAAMRVEHGKTLKKRPRCMDHLVSLYREMIEAALAASPTPEETKI